MSFTPPYITLHPYMQMQTVYRFNNYFQSVSLGGHLVDNLALANLEEEGYYSPRDRYLNKNELRSVLKVNCERSRIKFFKI